MIHSFCFGKDIEVTAGQAGKRRREDEGAKIENLLMQWIGMQWEA